MQIRKIIISRTDAIGDVILTLPLCSYIKKFIGNETRVIFFGKTYTRPVISCCTAVDEFIDYDTFSKLDKKGQADILKECNADAIIHVFPRSDIAQAAKSAGIPMRIGTTNRLFHWTTCNKLVRLSRKNSDLHEAQLNFKLLKPLGLLKNISLKEIPPLYNFDRVGSLPEKFSSLLSSGKFKLIIHPKSNASAREWKIDNYAELIRSLPKDKFQIIITGGKPEEALLNEWTKSLPAQVLNLAGQLSLDELISLINSCNGIIAASTGPLHIASALGKYSLGIYPPIRPMDPRRWAPVGYHAEFLVSEKSCSDCRLAPASCHCINDVTPKMAELRILNWI